MTASPFPSNAIDDPPNFDCAVLIWALPTVCKSFLAVLSMTAALVKFSSSEVPLIAVRGPVGGVKFAVYTAVPGTIRSELMYPINIVAPAGLPATLAGDPSSVEMLAFTIVFVAKRTPFTKSRIVLPDLLAAT
jgi:hypothetical protein